MCCRSAAAVLPGGRGEQADRLPVRRLAGAGGELPRGPQQRAQLWRGVQPLQARRVRRGNKKQCTDHCGVICDITGMPPTRNCPAFLVFQTTKVRLPHGKSHKRNLVQKAAP